MKTCNDCIRNILSAIPSNWCDSLLTGEFKVMGEYPYSCPDIERLLNKIRERIIEKTKDQIEPKQPPITFEQALDVFMKELKENEELYWAYEINIAQAFIDALPKEVITASQPIEVWCSIAKGAAKNFLDSLIKKEREE